MQTLRRVLANGVLDALRERDHVVVAPEHRLLLCNEVEAVIAQPLDELAAQLAEPGPSSRPRSAKGARARTRTRARSLGARGEPRARSSPFANARGDQAVAQMVQQIAEQIMASDHVDDIFADDKVIRRDTLRAIKRILLGYVRGELELEEEDAGETFVVALDSLGYVVSTVAKTADPTLLRDALERAAAAAGGTLASVVGEVCQFRARGGAATTRLHLEEAITQELLALADAELAELPAIEQVLEISDGSALESGVADALYQAEASARHETGCLASCTVIDPYTLIATLTPLSADAAANAEGHFERFLAILEEALARADGHDAPSLSSLEDPGLGESAPAPPRQPRRRPKDKQASGARGRGSSGRRNQPPQSSWRGRAEPDGSPAETARASRTRARGRKAAKKRDAEG